MRIGWLGQVRREVEDGIRRNRKARALSETTLSGYAQAASVVAPAYGSGEDTTIENAVENAGAVPSALADVYASRPDPATVDEGALFIATDTPRRIYRNRSANWDLIGAADHGVLAGLGDDDHSIYYNAARLATWHADALLFVAYHVTAGDGHTHSGGAGDGGGSVDHHNLANLNVHDDHAIYALLNGRAGGQTLIGGTAAGNNLTLQSTSHATRGMIVLADPTLGHSSTHAAAKPALANNHCGIALEHDPNNQSVLVYGYGYMSNPIFQVAKKGYTGTPYAAWDPSANIQFQVSADGSAWFAGNVEVGGFTAFGSGNTPLKCKVLTGTLPASGYLDTAHGLDVTKLTGYSVLACGAIGGGGGPSVWYPPNNVTTNAKYRIELNSTNLRIAFGADYSLIAGHPFVAMLFYSE